MARFDDCFYAQVRDVEAFRTLRVASTLEALRTECLAVAIQQKRITPYGSRVVSGAMHAWMAW